MTVVDSIIITAHIADTHIVIAVPIVIISCIITAVSVGLFRAVRNGGYGTISPVAIWSIINIATPPHNIKFSISILYFAGNFFLNTVVIVPNTIGGKKQAIYITPFSFRSNFLFFVILHCITNIKYFRSKIFIFVARLYHLSATMPVERVGVSFEPELLSKFDKLIRKKGYTNRSEAIRDLVRKSIIEADVKIEECDVIGTLTIVYEHERKMFINKLLNIEHLHHGEILSTTHVHIDKHTCLEVLIISGKTKNVKRLADKIIAIKGVKHGELVITKKEL